MSNKPTRKYQSGREVFENFIPDYVAPRKTPDEELFNYSETKAAAELSEALLSPLKTELEHLDLPQSTR